MKYRRARTCIGRTFVAAGALAVRSSLETPSGATAFQCRQASLPRSSERAPRRKRPAFVRARAKPSRENDDEPSHRHIDLQSDTSRYGRGEDHITFDLRPGDVVVYQQGTWCVDGVAVGPGDDPYWSYAMVDGLQVVWTHNCEHGVVRGWHLDLVHNDEDQEDEDGACISVESAGTILRRYGEEEEVEFGPEQVLGRINNIHWDDDMMTGITPIPLYDDIWRRAAEEQF